MQAPQNAGDGWNANLATLLEQAARLHGDRAAVVERADAVSYAELWARARAVAAGLGRLGLEEGESVAVFLERGAAAAAAYFGIVAAGMVAVVVNDRLRPRQVDHVVRDSFARVLLTSEEMLKRQPHAFEAGARVVEVEELLAGEAPAELSPAWRMPGDVAQIIYTSGSTGLPKGVAHSHGGLHSGMRAVTEYLGLRGDDRVAGLLPFSSVYGFNQLLCSVGMGSTLVVERSPLPQQIVQGLRAQGVTVLAAVPPLWLQLLGVPGFRAEPLATLRVAQNAGGHLPVAAVRELRAAQPHARLFLQYGQTETFRGTFLPPEEVDRHPDSLGRAIPGAEILVLREDGTPCAPGEVGELVHRGPTVALGYWNDPEATARVFRPHPLLPAGTPPAERVVFSGDMVRADADGLLYYVGRRDKLIKTLGYRVGPDEVMDVIHASGEVAEGVVSSEPCPQRGERIVAFVVLAEGGCVRRLDEYCRREMPRHMQPARFEVRTTLPRTAAGKYDLQAFRVVGAPAEEPASALLVGGE